MVSQSLSVVPGRGRNHSLVALFLGQSQQLVQRATFLERRGPLQVVEFQINGIAGELRKSCGNRAGREIDGLANAFERGLDVGESDHLLHSTRESRISSGPELFLSLGGMSFPSEALRGKLLQRETTFPAVS